MRGRRKRRRLEIRVPRRRVLRRTFRSVERDMHLKRQNVSAQSSLRWGESAYIGGQDAWLGGFGFTPLSRIDSEENLRSGYMFANRAAFCRYR